MTGFARAFSWLVGIVLIVLAGLWVYSMPRGDGPQVTPVAISGMVDRIVVEKAKREMTLFQGDRAVRRYKIALGFSPSGDKARQGDGRTPEGVFRIDRRNDRSRFHLSLGLDYPQPKDIQAAKLGGYDPGGDIMIHGQPNSLQDWLVLPGDWTAGCIALSNAEMREVWAVTDAATRVEIRP